MPAKSFTFLAIAAAVLPFVSAHGDVHSVSAGGRTINALNPYYAVGESAVRVMNKNELPHAFIEPQDWRDNSKFACEGAGNKPAKLHLDVRAGEAVTVRWRGATNELHYKPGTGNTGNVFPWVHATGPILDYLTDCRGDCSTFDATNAGWTKIKAEGIEVNGYISDALRNTMKNKGGVGEVYYPTGKGLWASAKMIQQGSYWPVTIPKNLKSGKYLLRHEVSSMHSPGKNQNYIACIQLNVINGGGATLPAGTQARDLYDPNGPFAKYNIYTDKPEDFQTPGPALWTGENGAPQQPEPPKPEPPKPEPPKPEQPKPEPPKPEQPKPEPPKPEQPKPEPPKPEQPKPEPPKQEQPKPEPPKCKHRKRNVPVSPVAAKRNHRKRLNVEH